MGRWRFPGAQVCRESGRRTRLHVDSQRCRRGRDLQSGNGDESLEICLTLALGASKSPSEGFARLDLDTLESAQGNVRGRFLGNCKSRFQLGRGHQEERHFEFGGGIAEVVPSEKGIELPRGFAVQIVGPWNFIVAGSIGENRIGLVLIDLQPVEGIDQIIYLLDRGMVVGVTERSPIID